MDIRRAVLTFANTPKTNIHLLDSLFWGENLTGTYQDLPNSSTQIEVSYGTVLGVDTYQHVPFIDIMDGDTVVTWHQGLEDEDTEGQSIYMSYKNGSSFVTSIEVIPSFSNSGSVKKLVPVNQRSINVDDKWYYLASVFDTTSTGYVGANVPMLGLIAVERLTNSTFGTPFWVHTPSGTAPTPQSGFAAYSFNEPISGDIRDKIRSNEYQILAYTDVSSGFNGVLTDGVDDFLEISAIKKDNDIVRLSRNFTGAFETNQRLYFDNGDGMPLRSELPSPPMRGHIELLNDNKIGLANGYVGGNSTSGNFRKEIWLAVANDNSMRFEANNIYRIAYGQDTGQIFPGAFKNGVWAYPHFIHDAADNKIKLVCSKYKEGIFYFEFNYSDIIQ